MQRERGNGSSRTSIPSKWRLATWGIGLAALFGLCIGCGEASGGGANGNGGGQNGDGTPRYLGYIRSGTYSRIVGEVDYVDGSGPDEDVMSSIGGDLQSLLDKPDGIAFGRDKKLESRGSDHTWTDEELAELASSTFDKSVDDGTTKIHVLYVDGNYEGDSDNATVLGLAWGHRNIAMFEDNIEEACQGQSIGPLGDRFCQRVEKSVLIHEVGHTIGLVNNGLDPVSDHHDEAHGAHCDNDDCVMYWRNRTSDVVERLADRFMRGEEDALGFGSDCREDIAAVE